MLSSMACSESESPKSLKSLSFSIENCPESSPLNQQAVIFKSLIMILRSPHNKSAGIHFKSLEKSLALLSNE